MERLLEATFITTFTALLTLTPSRDDSPNAFDERHDECPVTTYTLRMHGYGLTQDGIFNDNMLVE